MSQSNQPPEDDKEAWDQRIAQNSAGAPGQPQPVLQYGSPPMERSVNSVGTFFLRSLVGFAIGIVASVMGYYLVVVTDNAIMLFVPLGAAITVAIVLLVKYKRFGYITGMLLAPLAIVAALLVLLLIICGRGGMH